MKFLLLILLLPCIVNAQDNASTLMPQMCGGGVPGMFPSKKKALTYDTIGPMLRLVSDSSHDHYNIVGAMWVYEVRIYVNRVHATSTGRREDGLGLSFPDHYAWLDSKKELLTLKVWEEYK